LPSPSTAAAPLPREWRSRPPRHFEERSAFEIVRRSRIAELDVSWFADILQRQRHVERRLHAPVPAQVERRVRGDCGRGQGADTSNAQVEFMAIADIDG
jgi:hypothetical protein